MGSAPKFIFFFILVFIIQLRFGELLGIGGLRPDLILIPLVYLAARYGRIPGIMVGFGVGMLQDLSGSLSVLGANALAKSVVGYTLGTLNGNLAIWTPRVIQIYIYGSVLLHAIIVQTATSYGSGLPVGDLVLRALLDAFISGLLITGMRFIVPLVPARG